jgi:tricarballylate dehydrogenase
LIAGARPGGCASEDTLTRVLDTDLAPLPGLYAAGELVGGLFYFNYPGGTGLMSGAVFGRIAGTSAGQHAARSNR